MALYRNSNKKEIAPCIVSKVKYALGLKRSKPINYKKCSANYWNEVVEVVAEHNSVTNVNIIKIAKSKYSELI